MDQYNFENSNNYKALVQVQDRESKYGEGSTKRVIEFEVGKGVKGGFTFGDIAESVTDSIMCPTTPWLELGGGAVEWAIADAAGHEIFEKDAKKLMNALRGIKSAQTRQEQLEHAVSISQLFALDDKFSLDAIVDQSLNLVTVAEGSLAVPYGTSVPIKSGNLSKRGIEKIILTNVTPNGRSMTKSDMAMFTKNAIESAVLSGSRSITIASVGTGFAAAFGFGLSYKDSINGYLKGIQLALSQNGIAENIDRIDYNMYTSATQSNASGFAKDFLAKEISGFDFIYPIGE